MCKYLQTLCPFDSRPRNHQSFWQSLWLSSWTVEISSFSSSSRRTLKTIDSELEETPKVEAEFFVRQWLDSIESWWTTLWREKISVQLPVLEFWTLSDSSKLSRFLYRTNAAGLHRCTQVGKTQTSKQGQRRYLHHSQFRAAKLVSSLA